jgi:pilus assembly protein FimV
MRVFAVIGWMALLSSQLSALEVSELRLHSHLGEPLLAEFQLSSHDSFDPQNLMIKLAPAEIYPKMGIDVPSVYLNIKFELEANGLVKVTTRDPVKEPYLNFILQVRWPAGQLYKEFSVLLDPK